MSRSSQTSLAQALRDAAASLAQAGQPAARLEAELLLCEATALPRTALFAHPEQPLTATEQTAFDALLARRLEGEPMAYILGRRDFHVLTLHSAAGALIPRPETELLVDWALAALPAAAPLQGTDLGTGSGAIALALAAARPNWTLYAVERDIAALDVAAANTRRLDAANLHLLRGDWLAGFAPHSLDLVVANPPYVRAGDPHLRQGDVRFEPCQALAAGVDGLAATRAIAPQAAAALRPGGLLLLEHGWQQGAEVRAMLRAGGWCAIVTRRDLAGLERATGAHRPSC
ncbi:protein-(glutamine-N5) methyltransferase, release factor-specific [Thiohalocapsa halophila]|uniref:Release factor glutamine methyltransferase n=1 Tax=Thiohalocapsa halophila TaxID=69359 RepID=A0ABS1CMR4_9GAMM|nr:peptide chain release factor N(5)-glutamine methyltransferase [Thiohalocapsa halophila]MBK1633190.1 protein-(glutamine-N5) methyltransferase, release factor-specific [Thiohalocapsa halophila]